MFPFTIQFTSNYKKTFENGDKKKVLHCINIYVHNFKGKEITIKENCLSFKSNFWGWKGDKFGTIEKGKFVLTDTTISFKFYMYRFFIITTIMSSFIAYASKEFFIGIFFFLGLTFFNWIISLMSFRNMTKDIARKISEM